MCTVTSATGATPTATYATTSDVPLVTTGSHPLALHVYELNGRRFGVARAVHVLSFTGSQFSVKIGLAHGVVDGGRQTPSTMCRTTVGCVAAVNADYFDLTQQGAPDPGDEVGGIIQNCVLLHTPEISHQQANLDAQSVSEGLNWKSTVDVNNVSVPISAINQQLPMSYLNVNLPLAGNVLFTSAYGLPTPSGTGRTTYEFTQGDGSVNPTTINTTTTLELTAQTHGAVAVAPGHVDISAPNGSMFATLQIGSTVMLSTTSNAGCDNIGGHPILLNDGVATPIAPADTYMAKPFARSVIGWTASGETVIMTVAGKDDVSGATADQLVSLLRSLNVITALDLDGGISTSLYTKPGLLKSPLHGGERAVSTALLVVANQ